MSQSILSSRSLYLQVRDALAERIAKGAWRPGTSIPNEGELAREFGVSPGTMRKALDLIEGERLVTRRQGRGTFVNDQASDELAIRFSNIRGADGERIVAQVEAGEIVEGRANELECERLRLRTADPVYRIRRIQSHAGQPFMVEEASLPGNAVSRAWAEERRLASDRGPGTAAWNVTGQGAGAHFDRPGLSGSSRGPGHCAGGSDPGAGSRHADARRLPGRVARRPVPSARSTLPCRNDVIRAWRSVAT